MSRLLVLILSSIVVSVSLSGCVSLRAFKDNLIKASSQQQVEPAGQVSPNIKIKKSSNSKVKQLRAPSLKTIAPSNNCSYIVRDLSVPNATAVWCMPKVQRR